MSGNENIKLMNWGKLSLQILEDDERIIGRRTVDWKAWKGEVYSLWVIDTFSLHLSSLLTISRV
jgi:hypothetical protein